MGLHDLSGKLVGSMSTGSGSGCNERVSQSLRRVATVTDRLARHRAAPGCEDAQDLCSLTWRAKGRRINGTVRVHDAVPNATVGHDLDRMD